MNLVKTEKKVGPVDHCMKIRERMKMEWASRSDVKKIHPLTKITVTRSAYSYYYYRGPKVPIKFSM